MLDLEVVKKTTQLSRLRLDKAELIQLNQKLQTVLDFFDVLQEVPVEGIPPFSHGVEKTFLREDRAEASLMHEEVLQNAPESLDHCFKLPRVIGGVEE
jgi:aspartyl-tRNA(Asn)/glutamyl-tRNA(Gln) amidotransferase subunit C